MSPDIYTVTQFQIVAPYTRDITFNDGKTQLIDFSPMLRGELYEPLRDPGFFNQVRLDAESGTCVWPNDADFDPATLHDWDQVSSAMIEMAHTWTEPLPAAETKQKAFG